MKLFVVLLLGIAIMALHSIQELHLLPAASMGKQQGERGVKKHLGDVKSPSGMVLFHVMTHFYTVRAALELHGHSRILFFDKNWKQLAYCEVDMPDELPEKLINNSLCFKYQGPNNQWVEYKQLIGSSLPKQLCVEPNANCYTLYNK